MFASSQQTPAPRSPLPDTTSMRIDPHNGLPYTYVSFLETYENGQEIWDNAALYAPKTCPVMRLNVSSSSALPPATVSVAEERPRARTPVFEMEQGEFPSIGGGAARSPDLGGSRWQTPPAIFVQENTALNPEASEFHYTHGKESRSPSPEGGQIRSAADLEAPGLDALGVVAEGKYNYRFNSSTTNSEFWKLPQDLWSGEEEFPQPLETDEGGEGGGPDWVRMTNTWTSAQWREFGIKYFYGYVQQSSLLLDQMEQHQFDSCRNEPLLG